jgi:hypothetical protein
MTVRLVSMDASSVHGQAMATRPGKEGRWLAGPGRGRVAWPFSQTPARPSFFGVARTTANFALSRLDDGARFKATSSDVADGGVAASEQGGNVPGHALL